MNLYLIRHTKVNCPKTICYGQTDVDVCDSFAEEANEVLKQLNGIEIDEIWASPLQRCAKLADYLFSDKDINYDKRLMELNFGDWEGKAWADIYDEPGGEAWMNDYVNLRCPNGESFNDQIERVISFLNEKREQFTRVTSHFKGERNEENGVSLRRQHRNIAIVAHAGTIRSFISYINKVKPKETFNQTLDYGSVNLLRLND